MMLNGNMARIVNAVPYHKSRRWLFEDFFKMVFGLVNSCTLITLIKCGYHLYFMLRIEYRLGFTENIHCF